MKQQIVVPSRISPTFFALPCVSSAHKRGGDGTETYYILLPSCMKSGDWEYAHPGDTLVEWDDGKWTVKKRSKWTQHS